MCKRCCQSQTVVTPVAMQSIDVVGHNQGHQTMQGRRGCLVSACSCESYSPCCCKATGLITLVIGAGTLITAAIMMSGQTKLQDLYDVVPYHVPIFGVSAALTMFLFASCCIERRCCPRPD